LASSSITASVTSLSGWVVVPDFTQYLSTNFLIRRVLSSIELDIISPHFSDYYRNKSAIGCLLLALLQKHKELFTNVEMTNSQQLNANSWNLTRYDKLVKEFLFGLAGSVSYI